MHRNIGTYNSESYRLVLSRCESALEETKKNIYNIKHEVLQIIANHESIISINELAAMLKTSSRTLTRKLKKYDISFKNIITEEKLRRTNYLLKTEKSISIIARELSFNDSTAFCRFVRNNFNCSPTELRKELTDKNQSI
jgi:AraC-like DNA-binding protein